MFRGGQTNARFPHQYLGHLMVIGLGPLVYGLDPIERKILWEKNLYGSISNPCLKCGFNPSDFTG